MMRKNREFGLLAEDLEVAHLAIWSQGLWALKASSVETTVTVIS